MGAGKRLIILLSLLASLIMIYCLLFNNTNNEKDNFFILDSEETSNASLSFYCFYTSNPTVIRVKGGGDLKGYGDIFGKMLLQCKDSLSVLRGSEDILSIGNSIMIDRVSDSFTVTDKTSIAQANIVSELINNTFNLHVNRVDFNSMHIILYFEK